ncbi:MAG TPA: hypothetical protein VLG44_04045 [Chlamydiales bacterium]|nr:hypothetical protein [Chlamydiales bacterium]
MAAVVLHKIIVGSSVGNAPPPSPDKPKVKTSFQRAKLMQQIRLGVVSKEVLITAINNTFKLTLSFSASKAEIEEPLRKLKTQIESNISKTKIEVIEKEDSKAYSLLVKLRADQGKVNTFLIQLESLN